jgi:uncharacterized membrane protein YbhN (UPF0104 family)
MTTSAPVRATRPILQSRRMRAILRAAVGVGILIAIIARAGAEPFARGLASISAGSVTAAVLLTGASTAAAAWRWRLLAGRLGLALTWPSAMSAYYRSQFLNTILPGGVVGDVDRAVSHGRSVSHLAQASRAVAAERSAGQAVQLAIAAAVLVTLGMSVYAPAVGIVLMLGVVAGAGVFVAALVSTRARVRIQHELGVLRTAFADLRTILLVVVASLIVVAAHVAIFVVATVAVGVDAPTPQLTAVALIAMLAASIPFNIGGWGPREGAAAWAFMAGGLGAATGLAASTAYGVLAMIALIPGAVVVAASVLHRRRDAADALEDPS